MRRFPRSAALAAAIAALLCMPGAAHALEERVLAGFERPGHGWRLLEGGRLGPAPCPRSDDAADGAQSLRLGGPDPGAGVALTDDQGDWHRFTELALKVRVPEAAPGRVQALVYLKDADLHYYQHFRGAPLPGGRWTEIALDLRAVSEDWRPVGHFRPWDGYCRQGVSELGVKLVAPGGLTEPALVDSVVLRRDPDALPAANAIYDFHAGPAAVPRYGKFEITFTLASTYSNPFDPGVVDVTGRFTRPDGSVAVVPGFIYQGYLRRWERGAERLVPMGRRQWKVRFAPRQLGTYRYHVEVDDGRTIRTPTAEFRCVEGAGPGFVRISERDPRYLELDDGSFYYPIGHNIAAVHDARAGVLGVSVPAAEGTYAYDRFLRRMAEAGENFGRLWMSPWSFGLEWTKAYDVHYQGLGRYNLRNAWRLDHVLDAAAQRGIRCMLLFTAHGELGDYESDFTGHDPERRQGSPYWSRYGGPLEFPPRDFYTDPEVLKLYKRKVRYIAARWGYSTAVMAWELLNEPDLSGFFQNMTLGRQSAEFVRQVAQYLRSVDPAGHLITSGLFYFRRPWAEPTLSLDELDLLTGHVFHNDLAETLLRDREFIERRFGKIFLATEAGLTPFARDPDLTARAIHATIWSSCMLPYAGAAAPWWWVLIDQKDLYGHFAALAAFCEGEDRRGADLATRRFTARDASGDRRRLFVLCLMNERRALGWVYSPLAFTNRAPGPEEPAPADVTVSGLADGAYAVEFWDTRAGEVVGTVDAAAEDGRLSFRTAPFRSDLAFKLLPAEPR